jgi:hypothetical protein
MLFVVRADVAWYEGRYPSQLATPGQQQKRGAARKAALAVTDTGRRTAGVNQQKTRSHATYCCTSPAFS